MSFTIVGERDVPEEPPREGVGFAVLYRWRIDETKRQEFVEAWATVTREIREHCGGLGSRLHRTPDGLYCAYAQWPSRAAWAGAKLESEAGLAAGAVMKAALIQRLPDLELDFVEDLLAALD